MKNVQKDTLKPYGVVLRRTYSASKLKLELEQLCGVNLDGCYKNAQGLIDFNVLCEMGMKLVGRERFAEILERSVKKQFADNMIWRFLKKHFNLDVAIPGITGYYSKAALKANLIVNTGHKMYADRIGGTNGQGAATAMAYGTGTNAAAAGDTSLQTEVARAAATITNQTTSTTGDTERWVYTFTAAGTQTVTEEGLLDNNTSGGTLLARNVFSGIPMLANDTIQFTHNIQS